MNQTPSPAKNTPAPATVPEQPEKSARILVVDDQPANIQVLGGVLGRLGYEIVPASDGPTALKRLQSRPPDLVLLDLLMPEMDGLTVCRKMRENPDWKHIPVVFLSAADDKDLIVRALEAGGMDYITKPFNQAELVSRVRTHLDLKFARDRLAQLAEDKDELMGILAHDLKNHLAAVQMSAQLLRERLEVSDDRRLSQLSDNIFHSSSRLLSFVQEFLANAAADHGFSLKPEPLHLSTAALRAVQSYQEAARRKQIQIVTKFSSDNTTVLADAGALDQVMDNLLSNALKFSPPGAPIEVTVDPRPDGVECRIKDGGPGFTDEDKTRIFRRYARLSARPTSGEPSTGLGLSIVQKLVRALGGALTLDSSPGQGSAFSILLPRPPANK